jgi:DNA-binding CsgD family transcriptional regulator
MRGSDTLLGQPLSALIVSVHRITQRGLPLIVFGAGLPQLAALAGEAKSYAERLFDYPPVGALDADAGRKAVREPVREAEVDIHAAALDRVLEYTAGYPYFLQEWAYHTWNVATESPITEDDVERATQRAIHALDDSFFRVRLDRLTPRERDYLRAMAELGPGPHRSGDIAAMLNMDVTTAGSLRTGLIRKGMIYSPAYGDTGFTVPMFDLYLRRSIPEWTPPPPGKRKR